MMCPRNSIVSENIGEIYPWKTAAPVRRNCCGGACAQRANGYVGSSPRRAARQLPGSHGETNRTRTFAHAQGCSCARAEIKPQTQAAATTACKGENAGAGSHRYWLEPEICTTIYQLWQPRSAKRFQTGLSMSSRKLRNCEFFAKCQKKRSAILQRAVVGASYAGSEAGKSNFITTQACADCSRDR
jgi:hypothetical protein